MGSKSAGSGHARKLTSPLSTTTVQFLAFPILRRLELASGCEGGVFTMMPARADIHSDAAAVDIFHDVGVGVVGEGEISQLIWAGVDQLVGFATRRRPKQVACLHRQSRFAEAVSAAAREDEKQLVRGMMT